MGTLSLVLVSITANSYAQSASPSQHYKQTNLVSDMPGVAPVTDPNLVNPWGLSRSSTSPWWVSDNGMGVATLYSGAGAIVLATTAGAGTAPMLFASRSPVHFAALAGRRST